MSTIPLSARPAEPTFPDTLDLIGWTDPVVETVGFPPHHPYVELLWLPIIGPSATWLYRRLADLAQHHPDGTVIDVPELAASIGLSPATGPNAPVQRSLRRVVRFGLARWDGRLAVRTTAPPLSFRHLSRLAPDLQAAHRSLVAVRSTAPEPARSRT